MQQRRYRLKPEFDEFSKHSQNALKQYISYYDYIEMNHTQRWFYEQVGAPCQNHDKEPEVEIVKKSKVNVVVENE